MKKAISNLSRWLPLLAILFIASCDDDTNDDVDDQNPNTESSTRSVRINFSVPAETEADAGHTYVYDGYTVLVLGANEETEFTDVNLLTGPFEAQVEGDVAVTVYHPDFEPTALSEMAYFGTTNQSVPSSSQEEVNIALDLVQGFVIVVTEDGSESLVTGLTINGVSSDLYSYYYTATDQVTVYIQTTKGIMTATDDVVIGGGVKYTVDVANTTFTVTFPTFSEPIDGDLSDPIQAVISDANVSYFESFKLYNDGTVDLYTGGKPTDIFIPAADLMSGYSLALYDVSMLKASWKVNTGDTGYAYSGYTNIYAYDWYGQDYRITVWANNYIRVENTSLGTEETYGNETADDNVGTYAEMLQDYGSLIVKHNWFDSTKTIGNFIWRANTGSGTIYVESYEVSLGDVADPVVSEANILGGIILGTDAATGAVGVQNSDDAAAVFVLAADMTNGLTLADYDLASVFNNLHVEWMDVTTSGITGYINIYIRDGQGNRARVDLMEDGSIYIDAITLIPDLDTLLDQYGTWTVRTDYVENQGLSAVNGNFVWRTGDQRGVFRVDSYSLD